jgi:uncharacterized protein (TIGR03545 family)
LIIALIALAAWMGRAHLGKQALVYHLQSYVGARVDAKQLSLNHSEASVFLNQVEVADPKREMKNLLQFEAASLKLDFNELKNRRIVIENGRLSQIKFSAPRTTSGKLELGIFDPAMRVSLLDEREKQAAGIPTQSVPSKSYSLAQRWRDSLTVDVSDRDGRVAQTFEIEPMVNQKSEQWVARFQEPVERISKVESALSNVEEFLSKPVDDLNPLRNRDKLTAAIEAINTSLRSLERVGLLIAEFESQSQKDIYELSQVQMRDQQLLAAGNGQQKFDPALINQLLVGEIERQLVAGGLDWFQQFRNSLPDPAIDFRPIKRGRDLHFGKSAGKPKVEIRKLQIDGAAEFANSHFNFAGTIENLCDEPRLGLNPIKFKLRAQGDPQVVVSGTLDRTAGKQHDTIQFSGIGIPQPAYTLGNADSILISMTDSSDLHVDATLNVGAGEKLSGTMTFKFDNVMLHADSVHQIAGGTDTAARLNESVSAIRSFQVTTSLGGTIARPTTILASDLGPQVAAALETVIHDSQLLAMRKKETLLKRTVDGELAQLKQDVTQGISDLNESWRANYSRLNRLKEQLSMAQRPGKGRPNKLR